MQLHKHRSKLNAGRVCCSCVLLLIQKRALTLPQNVKLAGAFFFRGLLRLGLGDFPSDPFPFAAAADATAACAASATGVGVSNPGSSSAPSPDVVDSGGSSPRRAAISSAFTSAYSAASPSPPFTGVGRPPPARGESPPMVETTHHTRAASRNTPRDSAQPTITPAKLRAGRARTGCGSSPSGREDSQRLVGGGGGKEGGASTSAGGAPSSTSSSSRNRTALLWLALALALALELALDVALLVRVTLLDLVPVFVSVGVLLGVAVKLTCVPVLDGVEVCVGVLVLVIAAVLDRVGL